MALNPEEKSNIHIYINLNIIYIFKFYLKLYIFSFMHYNLSQGLFTFSPLYYQLFLRY